MTPDEENILLTELLGAKELADFRRASLEQGIVLVRLRRKRRQIMQRAAIFCVPLLLLALFLNQIAKSFWPHAAAPVAKEFSVPVQAGEAEIQFINDEELFALFAGRSLALVGKPGEQQLVFLDQQSSGFLR